MDRIIKTLSTVRENKYILVIDVQDKPFLHYSEHGSIKAIYAFVEKIIVQFTDNSRLTIEGTPLEDLSAHLGKDHPDLSKANFSAELTGDILKKAVEELFGEDKTVEHLKLLEPSYNDFDDVVEFEVDLGTIIK